MSHSNNGHPCTVAAFKARMESAVLRKKVLQPSETQCFASAATDPAIVRLAQLAVPSPKRLEALPPRMRPSSAGPSQAQLKDRLGSIQYRQIGDSDESPFTLRVSEPNGIGMRNDDAGLSIARGAAEERAFRHQPHLAALSPHKFSRISPSPNSFVNLSPHERRERLRVVSPDAREYVCTLRDRLSPNKVSSQLAYAVYGTAMKDADAWADREEMSGSVRSGSFRPGSALTNEEQIRSILRSEKRRTATTIPHEQYTILRNLFEEIDDDGSGFLELRELLQFRAQFPKRLPENVLHGLKLEQDGRVYLDDFLSTFYPSVSQDTLEQLLATFEPKAKDLASISPTALRELHAYYTSVRHTFWDFTLTSYAHRTGPFDLAREYDRQLRRCRRQGGKRSIAADTFEDAHGGAATAARGGLGVLAYHLQVYSRRHRRGRHADGCHYSSHTDRIRARREEQRLAKAFAREAVLRRANSVGNGRSQSNRFVRGGSASQICASASDTDTSAISVSSCSCSADSEVDDGSANLSTSLSASAPQCTTLSPPPRNPSPSFTDAPSGGRSRGAPLNAYQWYLHEASVLRQTMGDASIGAFVAKLRMRDVPLKPVIPPDLRSLLSSGRPSSVSLGGREGSALRLRRAVPSFRESLGVSATRRDDSTVSTTMNSNLESDQTLSHVLRFQLTPFLDGDQSVPNIPYLLACPISLKDFARVAMDYSMRREKNQTTHHFNAALSERLEDLRWHKMFPYTGDVRHFFKRFSDKDGVAEDDGSGIPAYIRRGAPVPGKASVPSHQASPAKTPQRKAQI